MTNVFVYVEENTMARSRSLASPDVTILWGREDGRMGLASFSLLSKLQSR